MEKSWVTKGSPGGGDKCRFKPTSHRLAEPRPLLVEPKGHQWTQKKKTLKVVGWTDEEETESGEPRAGAGAGLGHGQWADRWDLSGDRSR